MADTEQNTGRVTTTSNITVGKSWPRAATPCALIPAWEGEFCSFDDWVNFASKRLTVAHSKVTGAQVPAICVDALGRRCTCGGDFMRARDEDAFPVRYFFECTIGNMTTDQMGKHEGEEDIALLENATETERG